MGNWNFRPLPLEVIAEAISIRPEDNALDQDGIASDLAGIVAMCRSLIIVDRTTGIPRIALAHFSTEEFLQSDRIKQSSVAAFYMEPRIIHFELAKTCIQYLSFSPSGQLDGNDKLSVTTSKRRLWPYASQNWIKHFKASSMGKETFQTQIVPRLQWFLDPKPFNPQFDRWEELFECRMPSSEPGQGRKQHVPKQPAVFYALLYGIDLMLDVLFPEGPDVQQRFWDDMTPLHVAAFAGHLPSTERLLQAGADIDVRTNCKRLSPLHIASEQGHARVVEM